VDDYYGKRLGSVELRKGSDELRLNLNLSGRNFDGGGVPRTFPESRMPSLAAASSPSPERKRLGSPAAAARGPRTGGDAGEMNIRGSHWLLLQGVLDEMVAGFGDTEAEVGEMRTRDSGWRIPFPAASHTFGRPWRPQKFPRFVAVMVVEWVVVRWARQGRC